MACRPKAILSTDSPIVSAQEYDVRDLSAQPSSLEVCRWRVVIEKLYWSVVYCRKCLQYSILPQFIRGYIQVNFDRVYYAYLVDLLVCRRDQSCCDLEICFTRNMAVPITAGGTY